MKSIEELEKYLEDECYSFVEINIGKHHAHEGIVIEKNGDAYEFGYSERGNKRILMSFSSEQELVEYALEKLQADKWNKAHLVAWVWSEAEIQQAEEELKNYNISFVRNDVPNYLQGKNAYRIFVFGKDYLKLEEFTKRYYRSRIWSWRRRTSFMNFDLYEFLKYHNGSKFYPVKVEEIDELEKKLNLTVPRELKDLLLGIGYGFIKGSENNVNRIMDTDSIRDFRLRKGDFEFYPDIEIYDEYEEGKLIFFEGSESALISIELTDDNKSNIFYYDVKIADSLKEFLIKIQEDDNYYLERIV